MNNGSYYVKKKSGIFISVIVIKVENEYIE